MISMRSDSHQPIFSEDPDQATEFDRKHSEGSESSDASMLLERRSGRRDSIQLILSNMLTLTHIIIAEVKIILFGRSAEVMWRENLPFISKYARPANSNSDLQVLLRRKALCCIV
jgi:hypothetical protein